MLMLVGLFVSSYVLTVADAVPAFDVRKTCQGTEVAAVFPGRNLEACVASEETARDQLTKGWQDFPATDKAECLGLVRISGPPSYAELITCIEMKRDARKIHETAPEANESSAPSASRQKKK